MFERERQGVVTLTIVRGIFVVVLVVTVWIIGISLFEKIATTAIGAVVMLAIVVSLVLLNRRVVVGWVGLAGCAIDVTVLATLPVIWYVSVGGDTDIDAVGPAYMLKTQITVVTLALVVLNALAFRPLYPILVAAGGILVHLVLLGVALNDPRTNLTTDFAEAAMGDALSLDLVVAGLIVVATAGCALAYLTRIARRTVVQGVALEVTNAQISRYFSPGVAARIADEAGTLPGVGGRSQAVAVMFCDIRGFTTLTEALPPEEVVGFLSQYHERMVEVIFAFGGTIDKFIGDAIMVTFGTPDPGDDDAERSVRAALAMNAALGELNAIRVRQGLATIRHGIGIHFGTVVAGNIGTDNRLEYTVIGDTVNVASRIQDACKTTGETLLISEAVHQRLSSTLLYAHCLSKASAGDKHPCGYALSINTHPTQCSGNPNARRAIPAPGRPRAWPVPVPRPIAAGRVPVHGERPVARRSAGRWSVWPKAGSALACPGCYGAR